MVTGGGRGIGRATALAFAREGARVAVWDRDQEGAASAVEQIQSEGGRGLALTLDVARAAEVREAVAEVERRWGGIEILVNNAGIVRDGQLHRMTSEEFEEVLDVNLKGVFHCSRAVVEGMRARRGGVLLNASSVVAHHGNFGQGNYVAAKCGVVGLTRVWARELGPSGIRVNAVAPGFIDTDMTRGVPMKVIEKMASRVPLGRMGRPEEVARAYLWLASEEASYVTGAVLNVDGGAVV